jgi:hypothetical protein
MNPKTGKFEQITVSKNNKMSSSLKAAIEEVKYLSDSRSLLRPNGEPVPKHWAVFTIGELVTVKDQTMKVGYINESSLTLEPVPLEIEVSDDNQG